MILSKLTFRIIMVAGVFSAVGMGKFPTSHLTRENSFKWFQPLLNKKHVLKGGRGCNNIQITAPKDIPAGTVEITLDGEGFATWIGEADSLRSITETTFESDQRGGGDGSNFMRVELILRKYKENLSYFEYNYYTSPGANSPGDFFNVNRRYTLVRKVVCK
jgi:hypothetical protein